MRRKNRVISKIMQQNGKRKEKGVNKNEI